MEQYCGMLQPCICSCCFPFASLTWQVPEAAQMTQIKVFYDLVEELSLCPLRNVEPTGLLTGVTCKLLVLLFFITCFYVFYLDPDILLSPPHHNLVDPSTLSLLIGALVTHFDGIDGVTPGIVKQCLHDYTIIDDWGWVCDIGTEISDVMQASDVGRLQEDNRDASFVWVSYFFCILFHDA